MRGGHYDVKTTVIFQVNGLIGFFNGRRSDERNEPQALCP